MTAALTVRAAGPGLTLQDGGRPGYLAQGLSRGGAADRLAMAEGAALLGQSPDLAALEMAVSGGTFAADADLRIALTGAPMAARIDGEAVAWNASHRLPAGATLSVGGARSGTYGYLHVAGGFATPVVMGARGAHLAAGLGAPVAAGTALPVAGDRQDGPAGMTLDVAPRFDGGTVRVVPGAQTHLFGEAGIARFAATEFRRDIRGNRMGVRFVPDGEGFRSEAGLSVISEAIVPGDIQITGDGTPYVLLAECQTTGGYPRIGAVLPADLPFVAQAPAGARLRFRFVSLEDGVRAERQARRDWAALPKAVRPLVRDPARMRDLLSYQLISGVTAGDDRGDAA